MTDTQSPPPAPRFFCVRLSQHSTSPVFPSPEEALAFYDEEGAGPGLPSTIVYELEEVDPLSYVPFGSDLVRLLMDNLDGSVEYSSVDCDTFPCEKEHANRLEALVGEAYGRWISELRASGDWPLILDFKDNQEMTGELRSSQHWTKASGKWEPT